MIFQLQKLVTILGAGKEAYCTKTGAGKEAYCTQTGAGKEAVCTQTGAGKGYFWLLVKSKQCGKLPEPFKATMKGPNAPPPQS